MISRRTLMAQLALLGLTTGCGGSPSGPESDRNAYGHSLSELQGASLSLTTAIGPVQVKAVGNATSASQVDPPTWRVDPAGRIQFEPGTGSFYPVWYVAVALTNSIGDTVTTDWTVKTIWVLRGDELVSSRTLYTQDGKLFVVAFPNPPFSSDGTKAVVEVTRGGVSELVSASIVGLSS